MKRLKGCLLALLVVVVLSMLGLWHCARDWNGDNLPTEAELKAQFARYRDPLFRLRQMATEDELRGRVHAGYVDDERLSPQRLAEYRRLMDRAGITRLWRHETGLSIEFLVDAVGMLDSGVYKGFIYSEVGEKTTMGSLDVTCIPSSPRRDFCEVAHSLEPNWWVARWEFR